MLRNVDADETHRLLDYPGLIDALDAMYRAGVDAVTRLVLHETLPGQKQNDWLILPAWQYGKNFGVKLVSVFPENQQRGLASILGIYALFDGTSGMPLAVMDGAALTLRKTAANSALATRYLAREDVRRMAMLGAGALAPHLVMAHCTMRPSIEHLTIWNRSRDNAETMAKRLAGEAATRHLTIAIADTAEAAVRDADIVSAATMSKQPVVLGEWLRPGTHLDLVGAFRPDMRETDDTALARARLFCDARFTAAAECGDLCDPIARGFIDEKDLTDLFQLARRERPGRKTADEITLFKSGGGGHEDLATAQYLVSKPAQA
ncbi:MAG: ornithine cyclodeaminase family protein [Dongiaceae bacterium]